MPWYGLQRLACYVSAARSEARSKQERLHGHVVAFVCFPISQLAVFHVALQHEKEQYHCSEVRYDHAANGGMPCGQWGRSSHIFEFPRSDSIALVSA